MMGTGAEEGLAAGAGFAITTAGWERAGAGWMGWTWGRGEGQHPQRGLPLFQPHGRAAPCPPAPPAWRQKSGRGITFADGGGETGWDTGNHPAPCWEWGRNHSVLGLGCPRHGVLGATSTSAHAKVRPGPSHPSWEIRRAQRAGCPTGQHCGAGGVTSQRCSWAPKATWPGSTATWPRPRDAHVLQEQRGCIPKVLMCSQSHPAGSQRCSCAPKATQPGPKDTHILPK